MKARVLFFSSRNSSDEETYAGYRQVSAAQAAGAPLGR
jgi:hypothetical protein